MSGQKTISCTYVVPAVPVYLPCFVSGVLLPDCSCNYVYAGLYESFPYYRRLDSQYFIWFDPASYCYVISAVLGIYGASFWVKDGTSVIGSYDFGGFALGIAVVQFGSH